MKVRVGKSEKKRKEVKKKKVGMKKKKGSFFLFPV